MLFKKLSLWLALLGLVLGTILVYRSSAQAPQPKPMLPIPTKPFDHGIGASGIVESRLKNTLIGVPVAGLVTKVFVDVWDSVKLDTPLFQLDNRDLTAQLLTVEAQVKLKAAQVDRARDQYKRLQDINDPRAFSAQDLQDRKLDLAVSVADLESAKASVQQIQQLIDRLTVRSPIAGTILQVNVRAGEYVAAPNDPPPMILGDIADVWVRADIDEQVAPLVRANAPAIGFLKGDATRPIPMDFVRIEPYVIPKVSLTGASTERVDTRVLEVIYQFHNTPEQHIYAGQQVDLFIKEQP